jgi:arabinoxylan arabinofuranohydrolase
MRNKISIIFSLLLMIVFLFISTCLADYPIFYQRYTADPSGLEANGRIYLYCSHDVYNPNSPGYIMNDITCISTDDLKNWTDHGEVFKAGGWCSLSWAPSVVYRNNKFYLYFGNGGSGIGVAVSDSPSGPFTDPIKKALVTGSTPGVNPPSGFWCFDPGVFVDDAGQAYLYFGGNGQNHIRVIRLGNDMVSTVGSAMQMSAPRFFEAAHMHKYNGNYYFTYSTNFSQGAATINYMMSSSPTTGFVDKGMILPNPPSNEGNNNHHSIFSYKGKWYIAYHNRALAIANGASAGDARTYQRSVCLDRVNYNADGTMQKVTITTNGLPQLKNVDPYVVNEAETMAQESGINTESCSEGGRNVCNIENGDWIKVKGVDFGSGATSFEARVASASSGGNIEIRLDSPTGTLVGTCAVSGTGGWQAWVTKSCAVSGASGIHDLYFRFTGGSGSLFNFNWWKFNGSGIPTPTPTPVTPTPTPTPTATVIPTPTPTPSGSYVRFRNAATGLYIDGMGSTANGSNACQWGDSNSANQQWTIVNSGGYVMIQNRATGLYLDGMGRTGSGSVCGQWSSSGSANQQWTIVNSGGYVMIQNRATGLYLDGMGSTGNGSNLCQWSSSGSANQQWQIR